MILRFVGKQRWFALSNFARLSNPNGFQVEFQLEIHWIHWIQSKLWMTLEAMKAPQITASNKWAQKTCVTQASSRSVPRCPTSNLKSTLLKIIADLSASCFFSHLWSLLMVKIARLPNYLKLTSLAGLLLVARKSHALNRTPLIISDLLARARISEIQFRQFLTWSFRHLIASERLVNAIY